jgi:hypothetical protein
MASTRAVLLVAAPTLTALVGQRIYAKVDPPPGYTPATDGSCVVLNVRGGGMNYGSAVLEPSITFRCIGETEADAWGVYLALLSELQDKKRVDNCLLIARLETQGQLIRNTSSDWPEVFCAFRHYVVFER